jgi:hypothetical protein
VFVYQISFAALLLVDVFKVASIDRTLPIESRYLGFRKQDCLWADDAGTSIFWELYTLFSCLIWCEYDFWWRTTMIEAGVRSTLLALLDEIEDLRAHQAMTTAVLSALPDLSTTDLESLKAPMLEKCQLAYSNLRKEIEEL